MNYDRLLTRAEVESITTLSRSSLYRKMRAGSFPEPIRIGDRAVRWRESEIREFIASRPRATGEKPTQTYFGSDKR